jgi:hypothetical protein
MAERRTEELTLRVSPKLAAYLDELVSMEHGYGWTREEAALFLIWRQIEGLRERKVLNRIEVLS